MKRLAPTLSLLALAGMANAEVLSDDAAKITVGLYYQGRMDVGRGSDTAGNDFSPSENVIGKSDTADFYFRRLRPSLKGTYGDGYVFQVTLAADAYGKPGTASLTLFDAFAGKKFTAGSLSHTVVFGKKNAWFYTANSTSTSNLLPSMRPATPVGVPNQVGFNYMLDAPMVRFGADILNNVSAGNLAANGDDTASASQDDGEGMWYSARVEITGTGEWSSRWMESFAGKPGKGFVIGLEAGTSQDDRQADIDPVTAGVQGPARSIDAVVYGIEGMLHIDGLTAVADFRAQKTSATADTGTDPDDVKSRTFSVQAGYAIQSGFAAMPVIEPAARFAKIDNNTDNDEEGPNLFGANGDYGASGRTIEIGLNGYLNGHKNKLSADFIYWVGEENAAGDDSTAKIFRVQHQLWF